MDDVNTGSIDEVEGSDRRRWVAAGLLAAGLLVQIAINVPSWLDALRAGVSLDVPPGGVSLLGTAAATLVWMLPSAIALTGLVLGRAWGPSAALANGLLAVLPALLILTWFAVPLEGYGIGTLLAHALLLAAAGVAATSLPWSQATTTPARTLLWLGAGAVIAGRFLPVSVEGRGAESMEASVVRFGGTLTEYGAVAVGVVALVAIAVVADRLPPHLGAGAAAVLAAAGLAPLSLTVANWLGSQPISPLAGLGLVGTVSLVLYLRELRHTPAAVGQQEPVSAVGPQR